MGEMGEDGEGEGAKGCGEVEVVDGQLVVEVVVGGGCGKVVDAGVWGGGVEVVVAGEYILPQRFPGRARGSSSVCCSDIFYCRRGYMKRRRTQTVD